MRQQTAMTEGPILPTLIRFTIPILIGNVFQQLYNMVDTIIVGRFVGADALAAVGSTGTLMFLILGFCLGFSQGFAVITSQRFGAGDERGMRVSAANALLLSLFFSVLMTAIFVPSINTILHWMNTPADILQDAHDYIIIIAWGFTATMFYNTLSCLMRALGDSKTPLFFLIFSSVLNVILDLTLIIVFRMGVSGAALATVLSQGVSAVLCALFILRRIPVLVPHHGEWRPDRRCALEQLHMGAPMALQFAITASGTLIMQSAINLFGSTAVAAFTAANKVSNLLTQGMVSMGHAMASYCGQNFGSGSIDRIGKGVRTAVALEIVYCLAAALVMILLLPQMIQLFFSGDTSLASLLPWARTYAFLSISCYIPLSWIFIFRNAMQGCGYALLPTLGGVVEFCARAAMAALGIHFHSYPLSAACDPAAWLTAGLFTLFAFLWCLRDMRGKQAGKASAQSGANPPRA